MPAARDLDNSSLEKESMANDFDTETAASMWGWFRFDSLPAGNRYCYAFPETVSLNGMDFRTNGTTGYYDVVTHGGNQFGCTIASLSTATWYFWMGTYDNGDMTFWINDSEQTATVSATGGIKHGTGDAIVGDWSGGVTDCKVAWCGSALQVLDAAARDSIRYRPTDAFAICGSNLTGFWPLLGDTTEPDMSGNGNDLTEVGTPGTTTIGPPVSVGIGMGHNSRATAAAAAAAGALQRTARPYERHNLTR